MAYFLQPSIVDYACSCGILSPLIKLYFCRHCLKLRCGFCVCHEVDSHFCSNCLENIPSAEAKHKKNRCNSCFDCPCCQHTLSARATTVTLPSKSNDEAKEGAEVKTITQKMYYLACLGCRWTSRDVGIPDQTVAAGSWPESDYRNATRFALLMEHYQAVVLQDKQERQDYARRKAPKPNKFSSLTDRTGLTVSLIRRQMGWSDKTQPKNKPITISRSIASEETEKLPDHIFNQKLNLTNVTNMKQRLSQPSRQPFTVNKLFPQHKSLSIKRSLRCRQCEHNVSKPEYNPSSVKYRIQIFASYHVPEVRIIQVEPLVPGKVCHVVLKFSNPTIYDMTVTLLALNDYEAESLIMEELQRSVQTQMSVTAAPNLSGSLSRQASLNEEPRAIDETVTGQLTTPESSFVLLHRDDSAEFDEEIQTQREEPDFVVWRKGNRVAVKLEITPNDNLGDGELVVFGFSLQYSYTNTVTNAGGKKDPQKHSLLSRVYIKAGCVGTSNNP